MPQLSQECPETNCKDALSAPEGKSMVSKKKAESGTGESLIICVCGMAGSGKSVLAKRLAQEYGLRYFSGGDALKALAIKEGRKPSRHGWWESEEGMRFLERRGRDSKFDKAVDKKLLEMAKKGNVVLDSWTVPWLVDAGFKIWLEASPERRAERIAKRDQISEEEALDALKQKEEQTKTIYKELYGFSLGEDFAPFHFIVDTNNLEVEDVFLVVCRVVENVVKNRKHYGKFRQENDRSV
jgi:cytidylate kinase